MITKNMLPAIFIFLLLCTSCIKNYKCYCETVDSSGSVVSSAVHKTGKNLKRKADMDCDKYRSSEHFNSFNYYATGNTTSCIVK